jgi:hypothetical protein
MADKNQDHQDRIHGLIKEVESLAKSLRTNLRKRADVSPVLKEVQKAADRLRRQAAATAGQVEKYVHSIRKELEKGAPKKAAAKKRPAGTRATSKKSAPSTSAK